MDGYALHQELIARWMQLSPQQIVEVSKICNRHITIHKNVKMTISPICDHKALQWTLANICATNLFPVFLEDYADIIQAFSPYEADWLTEAFVSADYALPYRQCVYCGNLDQDMRGKPYKNRPLLFVTPRNALLIPMPACMPLAAARPSVNGLKIISIYFLKAMKNNLQQ